MLGKKTRTKRNYRDKILAGYEQWLLTENILPINNSCHSADTRTSHHYGNEQGKLSHYLVQENNKRTASFHSFCTPVLVVQEGQLLAAHVSGSPSIPAAFASAAHPMTPPRFSYAAPTPPANRGSTCCQSVLLPAAPRTAWNPPACPLHCCPMSTGHKLRLMLCTNSRTLQWY